MEQQFRGVASSPGDPSGNTTAYGRSLTVARLNLIALVIAAGLWLATYFLNETGLLVMLLGLAALLSAGLLAVIIGTIRKNKWGINFESVACPCCTTQLPRIRKPKSVQQALWGGYTCPKCGAEVDKWGRKIN